MLAAVRESFSQVARCGGHGATKQILACFAYCFAPGAVGPLQAAGSKPEVFLKPHAECVRSDF